MGGKLFRAFGIKALELFEQAQQLEVQRFAGIEENAVDDDPIFLPLDLFQVFVVNALLFLHGHFPVDAVAGHGKAFLAVAEDGEVADKIDRLALLGKEEVLCSIFQLMGGHGDKIGEHRFALHLEVEVVEHHLPEVDLFRAQALVLQDGFGEMGLVEIGTV